MGIINPSMGHIEHCAMTVDSHMCLEDTAYNYFECISRMGIVGSQSNLNYFVRSFILDCN